MFISLSERCGGARGDACSPTVIQTVLGSVEYVTYGEGPTVIALHGGVGGYDQSLLLANAAIGTPNYRILAVSRPGYLGTPLASGQAPEEQADLCAALLDALHISQAGVIAVSAGGACALQFALRHPERCWGVVMVSACSGRLHTPSKFRRRLAMMKMLSHVPFVLPMMRRRVRQAPLAAAHRSIANAGLRLRTLQHPQAGPLMTSLLLSTLDKLPERLPGTLNDITQLEKAAIEPPAQIGAPILAIHGTGDRVVPFSHGSAVTKMNASSRLMAIEGGEHVSLFTHLDEIRECVGMFLAEHARCHSEQ